VLEGSGGQFGAICWPDTSNQPSVVGIPLPLPLPDDALFTVTFTVVLVAVFPEESFAIAARVWLPFA
jgi:hypothetical protein